VTAVPCVCEGAARGGPAGSVASNRRRRRRRALAGLPYDDHPFGRRLVGQPRGEVFDVESAEGPEGAASRRHDISDKSGDYRSNG
jgi:hypothetical protein